MRARILGNLVLGFHFAFVAFSVLGGFLVLWKRWIAWLHVPSVLWSSFVNLFSHVCPLTPMENRFRHLAGQAGYEGGFIEHYITPLVYPGGMPRRMELAAGYSILIWYAFVYAFVVGVAKANGASAKFAAVNPQRFLAEIRTHRLRSVTPKTHRT